MKSSISLPQIGIFNSSTSSSRYLQIIGLCQGKNFSEETLCCNKTTYKRILPFTRIVTQPSIVQSKTLKRLKKTNWQKVITDEMVFKIGNFLLMAFLIVMSTTSRISGMHLDDWFSGKRSRYTESTNSESKLAHFSCVFLPLFLETWFIWWTLFETICNGALNWIQVKQDRSLTVLLRL